MNHECLLAAPIATKVIFENERLCTAFRREAWRDTVRRMIKLGVLRPATAVIENDSVTITFFSLFTVVIDSKGVHSFTVTDGEKKESDVACDALLMRPFDMARGLIYALIRYIAVKTDGVISEYYDDHRDDFELDENDPDVTFDELLETGFFDPYQYFDRSLLRFHLVRSLRDFQKQLLDRLPWLRDQESTELAQRIWGGVNAWRSVNVFRNKDNLKRLACRHGNLLPLLRLVDPVHFAKKDLFDPKYWTNGNTEIFIPRPEPIEDRRPWQVLTRHAYERIAELPEDVIRELTYYDFGVELDFSAFLEICADASLARSALTVFKGLSEAFWLCWLLPEERELYRREKHPSWNDERMFAFLKRMHKLVRERRDTDEDTLRSELRKILSYVERQPCSAVKKPLRWDALLEEAREWSRRFWRRRVGYIEDFKVRDSLNLCELGGACLRYLWWDRILPECVDIQGCAVSECTSQIDVARLYLELGQFWPPSNQEIIPAVKGTRIFVAVRCPDGKPALLKFDRIKEGFVLMEAPSSPLLLEIGETLEDMLHRNAKQSLKDSCLTNKI